MIQVKFLKKFLNKGQKRLFLIFGIINFLITNIFLQIALLIIPTFFATVLSQILNIFIGYYLYGKKVFKLNNLNNFILKKYLLLALLLWSLNFGFIQTFFYFGVNKNLTAISVIPILVFISFLTQKYYVFK